jgi:hypothetical protein
MNSRDIIEILKACNSNNVAGIRLDGVLEANFFIDATENQVVRNVEENNVEMQKDLDDNKTDPMNEELPELGDLALDDPVKFELLMQGQSENYGE